MRIFAVAVAVTLIAGSAQAATLRGELTLGADLSANASGGLFDASASQLAVASLPDGPASMALGVGAERYSGLPDPSAWAMLILGFGAAGVMIRRQPREATYRLEEAAPEGGMLTEEFSAPDDPSALSRAASVVDGDFKLWRGDVLVQG